MATNRSRLLGGAATLASVALIAAGCGSSTSGSKTTHSSGSDMTTSTMTDTTSTTASSDASLTTSDAADTQIKLDNLLAEHAVLAQFATQKGYAGKKDFPAIGAALDQNSVDIAKVIGSVYGPDAQKQFLDGKDQWRDHIQAFVNYTVGLAKHDQAMQDQAVADLGRYNKAFPAFLAPATGLPVNAVETDISNHIGDLKQQIDQFSAGSYGPAYTTLTRATDHMYMTGDALAGAIAKQKDISNGSATPDAVKLRETLDRLLSEHAALAMFATQKGFDGDKDFTAAAGELDKNSVALSQAIASVYGDAAGKQFLDGKDMWRDHIKDFVAYTTALAMHDKAGQQKAVADLGRYTQTFGSFLASATGLPREAVVGDLSEHVGQLKQQIDDYAAGKYAKAYQDERMAYDHMFMTGDTLAKAIVAQHPDKFGGSSADSSMSH